MADKISSFSTLNIQDELTRECPAIREKRKLCSIEAIDALSDPFIMDGVLAFLLSDNGPKYVAEAVRKWIRAVGAKTAFIEPDSRWENEY